MSYGRFILVAIPPTTYDIVRLDGSLVIEAGAPINLDKVGQAWTKYPQFWG